MGIELLQDLAVTLFEEAPDAMLVVDDAGRIRMANAAAERVFGHPRAVLLALPVESLVPDRLRAAHQAQRASYAAAPRHRLMGDTDSKILLKRADGSEIPVEIALSRVDRHGETYTIAIVRDVSARKELEDRVRYLLLHDTVTGTYNRTYFDEELLRLGRSRTSPIGVLVADVDHMKEANDAFGHAVGDELLRASAGALRSAVRSEDVVARIGGDEFAVLLPGASATTIEQVTSRVRDAVAREVSARKLPMTLTLSLGGAVAERGETLPDALRAADAAMYADKRAHGRIRSLTPLDLRAASGK